jgi:hypothetical protein
MSRRGPIHRSWLIALAIALCWEGAGALGIPPEATAQEQRPSCANFLDQQDSQVAFDADPSDPFGLDESGQGDTEACETEEAFGTSPLVNCDDLRGHPDIVRALYDHSLSKYGADRYNLAACVEQESTVTDPTLGDGTNGGSQGEDPEVLDGVPPEPSGSPVVVSPVPLGAGETLEARLEARFAALEAQFAAFEVRAANGFGRFPESGDNAAAVGQVTTVGVSSSQQPIAIAQRTLAHDDGPIVRAQKAKDGNGERDKERRGNRKGNQRNRR